MFEEYQICPYTGLRSFTEEESLYFKGREEHISLATDQLQKNKFLMLTGASGDGKSSLVYAGIVPNARAGFLKSKYTQWCVADFRPERSPFQNLCKSLAKQLGISNAVTVEAELQHGFSALVDLYRNSKRFADDRSIEWNQSDDAGKAALKRSAANLIILVDQFEEFFTNPENYHNGVPSRDSNLVLNLLLETSRIALEEELPIYVVFTMRSDFIGQCAAFRGLPEYIGFSQFFVPRLNRSQLQQVIEDPATLSGNRIARRLTERLIHDITDGVDQLPILQHALNQIWVAADSGKEEMDLIHYAMVGGMSVTELPDDQRGRFDQWFATLPESIRTFYREPNLQNVLDTHTNKLYENAAKYYEAATGRPISEADAKAIIRNAFTCLTKIDQSRAVRNRMTLSEIAEIFGRPEFDAQSIGAVLNIFREPGNTFIRPFIGDDIESKTLSPRQALDITHESLIRNWEYLEKWAKEEFDSYSVSVDFGQQLTRWVKSGKAKAHLFSIGPLTYFENWFNTAKPNASWIARYLPEEIEREKKLVKARRILSNAQEFLHRSARRHIVTRTVMRYGPMKIAAVLGIMVILTLSSFAFRTYWQRQSSYILNSIHKQALTLAGNPKVPIGAKATLICQELRLGRTSVAEAINSISDPLQKVNVANGIASMLIFEGRKSPEREIIQSLTVSDSLMDAIPFPENDLKQLSGLLKEGNVLRAIVELGYRYNPIPAIDRIRQNNAKRSARWTQQILKSQPKGFDDIPNFTLAFENAINYKMFSNDEIRDILLVLSPIENGATTEWFQRNFAKDNLLNRGAFDYGFKFNGLYQELGYLYAAEGNSKRSLQCLDTLLKYDDNNFLGNYEEGVDNAGNIAAVFYTYQFENGLDDFVKGYCERKKIGEESFYIHLLGRTWSTVYTTITLSLFDWQDIKSNLNIVFSSNDQLTFFYNKYREGIAANTDADTRNFALAFSYKMEGLEKSLNKQVTVETDRAVKQLFDRAIEFYAKVGKVAREERVRSFVNGVEEGVAPRKYLFQFPDARFGFNPQEMRNYYTPYSSDVFMNYILENDLFDTIYDDDADLQLISNWLSNYNTVAWYPIGFASFKIRPEVLRKLEKKLSTRKVGKIDLNLLYMNLGEEARKEGKPDEMLYYYRKLDAGSVLNILQSKDYGSNVADHSFVLIGTALKGFAEEGHFDEAYKLLAAFKKPINRSSLYAFVASDLFLEKRDDKLAQQFIDSARAELSRVENLSQSQAGRNSLSVALTLQDPIKNSGDADRLIKNVGAKFFALQRISMADAFKGDLNAAMEHVPGNLSTGDQAVFLWYILYGFGISQPANDYWKEYDVHYTPVPFPRWIHYVDENN